MSLLITSNTNKTDESSATVGINSPYSYQNNLQDTFVIPKNSEIAVQSVKLNRGGQIALTEENSVFGFYFGEPILTGNTDRDTLSLCNIFNGVKGSDSALFPDTALQLNPAGADGRFVGSIDNIAEVVKTAGNAMMQHPNLMLNASTGINPGLDCVALRNASGLDWEGFSFKVTNTPETKNASNISAQWLTNQYAGQMPVDIDDYTYDTSTRLAKNVSAFNVAAVGIDFPLSQANGSCTFELVPADRDKETFMGLTRSLINPTANDGAPEYYDRNGQSFYDYLVEIEDGGDIAVYSAVSDGNTEIAMLQLNYGTVVNASNASISKIHFNVQGERVKIVLENYAGVLQVLCDGTSTISASNVKPTSQTTWWLYPKIELLPGKSIKIDAFNGVDIFEHVYGGIKDRGLATERQMFQDWWGRMISDDFVNKEMQGQDLCFNIDVERSKAITRTNQVGLNVNKQIDYKPTLIFAEDIRFSDTDICNSKFLFGFPGRAVVTTPTFTGAAPLFTFTYNSDTLPNVISTSSLFIRLRNMTFNSVNLAKGSKSKIIYHIPGFSIGQNRPGVLFHETNEKTYLKLNNTNDINLSTMEVDIVYANETLAIDLYGKTTVVLHIRDA
jgi:hypothetical protein